MEELVINGKTHCFKHDEWPGTLGLLLARLNVESSTVVAELDGAIIDRTNFGITTLRPGMKLELIRFVGGG